MLTFQEKFPQPEFMTIILFGFDGCPYCRQAKGMCEDANVPYDYVDISEPQNRPLWKSLGHSGVPVVYIDEVHLGGLNELRSYLTNQEVQKEGCTIM